MTIAFFILLMALSSCANKETGYNLPYDLPNEVGMWFSVSDTTYTSIYYPVNGSIYATDFEHDSISTYAFLGQSKLPTLSYVDVRTFEVNINRDGEHYARDKRHVYYPTDIDCIMFWMVKIGVVLCFLETYQSKALTHRPSNILAKAMLLIKTICITEAKKSSGTTIL